MGNMQISAIPGDLLCQTTAQPSLGTGAMPPFRMANTAARIAGSLTAGSALLPRPRPMWCRCRFRAPMRSTPKRRFSPLSHPATCCGFLIWRGRPNLLSTAIAIRRGAKCAKPMMAGFGYSLCTCIPKPAGRAMRPTPSRCRTCIILPTTIAFR